MKRWKPQAAFHLLAALPASAEARERRSRLRTRLYPGPKTLARVPSCDDGGPGDRHQKRISGRKPVPGSRVSGVCPASQQRRGRAHTGFAGRSPGRQLAGSPMSPRRRNAWLPDRQSAST